MSQSTDDSKAAQKAAKKAAKAAAKVAKKQGKPVEVTSGVAVSPVADESPNGLTPAERSARAAEHKVHWERRRFWLLVISVLVALAALLLKLFDVVGS